MKASNVSLEIMEFVEKNILPRYSNFDKAHDLRHAKGVIDRALKLAKQLGADYDMVYVAAAYHDLGLEGPRAVHHITSGKILVSDVRLKKWFTNEQVKIMKEAVEDHRASASHAPRSIYGKIVAEADRDLEPSAVFRRTVEYGLSHYPGKNKEQQWERFEHHLNEKYSLHGYIKLWIPNSQNERYLKQIRQAISDPSALRKEFERAFSEANNDGQGGCLKQNI